MNAPTDARVVARPRRRSCVRSGGDAVRGPREAVSVSRVPDPRYTNVPVQRLAPACALRNRRRRRQPPLRQRRVPAPRSCVACLGRSVSGRGGLRYRRRPQQGKGGACRRAQSDRLCWNIALGVRFFRGHPSLRARLRLDRIGESGPSGYCADHRLGSPPGGLGRATLCASLTL
jgi:hypothetical protein